MQSKYTEKLDLLDPCFGNVSFRTSEAYVLDCKKNDTKKILKGMRTSRCENGCEQRPKSLMFQQMFGCLVLSATE